MLMLPHNGGLGMTCTCGSTEHEAVPFGMVWGVGNMVVCPNDIITGVDA